MSKHAKPESKTGIRVLIKYLISIREKTGCRQEEVNFPEESNLKEVVDWLNERYSLSLPHPHIITTLNGRGWNQFPERLLTKLKDGDTICLFPPLSGG
jgi:molybdopterin converting factor small subunit